MSTNHTSGHAYINMNPNVKGAKLLYNGRTLHLQFIINTDEPTDVLAKRLIKTIKSHKDVMLTTMAAELEDLEQIKAIWKTVWDAAEKEGVAKPDTNSGIET